MSERVQQQLPAVGGVVDEPPASRTDTVASWSATHQATHRGRERAGRAVSGCWPAIAGPPCYILRAMVSPSSAPRLSAGHRQQPCRGTGEARRCRHR